MTKWKNYGDANPLIHGGIWVMPDENFEGCYNIVRYEPEVKWVFDLYIDINDSWIDRQAVYDFIGMSEDTFDEVQYAIGCIDYYNVLNFGNIIECGTEKEAIEELRKYEIKV